jgi:hypothetical protein
MSRMENVSYKGDERLTVRMPDVGEEAHRWWCERIVLRELELGGEHAALEGSALRTLNQTLPVEEVIFGDGTSSDAIWWVIGEGAVFLKEPPVGGGRSHDVWPDDGTRVFRSRRSLDGRGDRVICCERKNRGSPRL